MANANTIAWAGLAIAGALALAAWLPRFGDATTPAPDPAVEPGAAPAPPPPPPAPEAGAVRMAIEPPAPATEDPSRRLELPDGTFVPTLNGAVDPAPLAEYWGPRPYSPIVGIETAGGVEWYRHADGSCSTTQMVWRSDLGRKAAMTRVAHPGPTPPGVAR